MPTEKFAAPVRPILGHGIFGLSDVARYTKLHPNTVHSWFKGRYDRHGLGRVFQSDFLPVNDTQAASFHNLVDVLIARQFREFGVSLKIIRAAHTQLQKKFSVKHPFCRHELYTDGRQIIIPTADALGDNLLSEVVSGQQLFIQIKKHLKHIDYSKATRLAERWHISEGVVIDPEVNRGKPCISSTGIATNVVSSTYFANEQDAELVADLYEVSTGDVVNAVRFERDFARRAA